MILPQHGQTQQRGFALIVTLSVLVLLLLLVIGILSLSSISIRTASQEDAQAEARANARLALQLAIGELQKHAGADTRVTATADILASENPPLLGVWRSWEGSNHETSGTFAGRPIAPDYGSKREPAEDGGRFLTWLVSTADSETKPDEASTLIERSASTNNVALLAEGTLETDDDRMIFVEPNAIAGSGNFAWWISGENQKARVPEPFEPDKNNATGWGGVSQSHSVVDPEPFGLESLLDDPTPASKAITLRNASLIPAPDANNARQYFHDLSAVSVGLLTNTATGGWRKDLSLLIESWDQQPKTDLPFFRLTANKHTKATIPSQNNAVPAGSALYPWAGYRGGQTIPIYQHPAVTSWANLVDWATHYKRASISGNGRVTTAIHSQNISGRENYAFLHKVRILPIIARMQWVFSHSAERLTNGINSGKYEPRLLLTPVITMWNPYSAEITSPQSLGFIIPKAMPAALRYSIGGVKNTQYNAVMRGVSNQPSLGGGALRFNINAAFTLKPGETRLFSPQSTTPVGDGATITLAPGYRSGGGHFFRVKNNSGQVVPYPGATSIKVSPTAVRRKTARSVT